MTAIRSGVRRAVREPLPSDPRHPDGTAGLWDPAFAVYGADTSLWSLDVDFETYRSAGPSFVIIKALNGTTIDPYFSRNYARARAAGVPVSTYQWLLREDEEPIRDQVQAYVDLLRDYPHDFVPWLDYEGEARPHDLLRHIDLFLERSGRNLGVYSTFGLLQDAALPDRLASLRLWIAQYSSVYPPVPAPFRNWDFWQFTETMPGSSFGFHTDGESLVDMNYFNGTSETFRAWCDPGQAGTPEEQLDQRIEWEVPVPPLASGDTGIQVLKLQDLLVRASFMTNGQVSRGPGIFGPRTKAALINLQAALGLPSSGLYDEATRSAVIARYYHADTTPPVEVPTPPSPSEEDVLEERLMFDGNAVYRRCLAHFDRGDVQYHVLKVDLTNAELFVTPPPRGLTMVPSFLEQYGLDIAINGDGWRMSHFFGLKRLETTGENASRGSTYGQKNNQLSFYMDKQNRVSLRRPPARDLWNALSFPNLLVENGELSPRITRTDLDPRTALGFTRDGRYAILVAVDGREGGKLRSGMSFSEVARVLLQNGAWMGSNQDGGGSTTLAVRDDHDGQVSILNEPCGEAPFICRGRTYSIRPVANHLGIRFLASTPLEPRPVPEDPHPSKDEL